SATVIVPMLPALLLCAALAAAAAPPAPLPPARIQYDDGQDPMGNRTFRTTTLRQQISLAGEWDFAVDPDDRGRAESWFTKFPENRALLTVPGTWNTSPAFWPYIGAAWHRRT